MTKMVIAGSRGFCDIMSGWSFIDSVHAHFPITEVVCGMAKGVDTHGMYWAKDKGIPWKEFPADWDRYGKAAGPIRNKQMAEYADAAIVIHLNTKGSRNMISQMEKLKKPVYEWSVYERKMWRHDKTDSD